MRACRIVYIIYIRRRTRLAVERSGQQRDLVLARALVRVRAVDVVVVEADDPMRLLGGGVEVDEAVLMQLRPVLRPPASMHD